jgi:hypothetical protein
MKKIVKIIATIIVIVVIPNFDIYSQTLRINDNCWCKNSNAPDYYNISIWISVEYDDDCSDLDFCISFRVDREPSGLPCDPQYVDITSYLQNCGCATDYYYKVQVTQNGPVPPCSGTSGCIPCGSNVEVDVN